MEGQRAIKQPNRKAGRSAVPVSHTYWNCD